MQICGALIGTLLWDFNTPCPYLYDTGIITKFLQVFPDVTRISPLCMQPQPPVHLSLNCGRDNPPPSLSRIFRHQDWPSQQPNLQIKNSQPFCAAPFQKIIVAIWSPFFLPISPHGTKSRLMIQAIDPILGLGPLSPDSNPSSPLRNIKNVGHIWQKHNSQLATAFGPSLTTDTGREGVFETTVIVSVCHVWSGWENMFPTCTIKRDPAQKYSWQYDTAYF